MPSSNNTNHKTAFQNTGAVEQDRPEQSTNVAPLDKQLDHRYQDSLNKQNDSGIPERGQTPEFTGESKGRDDLNQDTNTNLSGPERRELNRDDVRTKRMDRDESDDPEGALNDQDPGQRQKETGIKRRTMIWLRETCRWLVLTLPAVGTDQSSLATQHFLTAALP